MRLQATRLHLLPLLSLVALGILFEEGLLHLASELLPLFTWLKLSSWASFDVTDKFLKPTADSNLNLKGRLIFFGYGSSAFKAIPVKFSKFKRIFSASQLPPKNKRGWFRSWMISLQAMHWLRGNHRHVSGCLTLYLVFWKARQGGLARTRLLARGMQTSGFGDKNGARVTHVSRRPPLYGISEG